MFIMLIAIIAFFSILSIVWSIIKLLFLSVLNFILVIEEKQSVKRLQEGDILKRKYMEQKMEEAEKEDKHREQILNEQNIIIEAGLSKVRELRVKYPYADEDIFKLYLKKFPSYTVDRLNELELKIKNSHEDNELKNSLNPKSQKIYTISDLDNLTCLEEYEEKPLIMRIYKPDNFTYLLYIKDIDTNKCQLLQSKDYLVVARTRAKIIEKQTELRQSKKEIKALDIDNIYENVKFDINLYRRNNNILLD